MKQKKLTAFAPWVALAALMIAAFVFFQWMYPYHLFRREQTMAFLMSHEYVESYLSRVGWISALVGDFLTQFYLYRCVGPLILSICLGGVWCLAWAVARKFVANQWTAIVSATLVMAWEWLRECGATYQLGSTIALAGALALTLLVAALGNRWWQLLTAAIIVLAYWCIGYGAFVLTALALVYGLAKRRWVTAAAAVVVAALLPWHTLHDTQWWNAPDYDLERKLALDSEAYFGNYSLLSQMAASDKYIDIKLASYYFYLTNALRGRLPEALIQRIPKDANALLPRIDERLGSIDISAYGDAWFLMGDMTLAEHCAILAMISSTHHTGTRYLRRMAEINLANGDNEAAMKYLRMLSKTIGHRQWAKSRMPGQESDLAKARIDDLRSFIVQSDTLRFSNGYVPSLRHLVAENPDNDMAYNYLLCYHLLNRDIKSFVDDLEPSHPLPRLYQEALLVYLWIEGASEDEVERYGIDDSTIDDFVSFSEMMPLTAENRQAVYNRFGNTYWYFFQLPSIQ